jgi:hypothetical protein
MARRGRVALNCLSVVELDTTRRKKERTTKERFVIQDQAGAHSRAVL